MSIQYIEEAALFSVVSTCFIAFLCYFITNKRNKVIKPLDIHLLNKRIIEFRPEPIIDPDTVKLLRNKVLETPQPEWTNPDCLNLSKVNYLNLLNDDDIKRTAENCIRSYGVGSCGPRGFYGTIDVHLDLESRLAEFMGMEETVLYSYAFSTIASAIGAYCKRSDIVFCDEFINFCSIQGLLAAKSTVIYFKHNDMTDLENKLKEYEEKEKSRNKLYRKFLLVEGIYSQTGTICPLPKLMELRKQYKLRIFLDESVSFGVLGKTGRGVTEHYDVDRSDVDMIMGSLEGSIGSIGGFCVGASVLIEHQRLSGLGYCFSASLPPFLSYISICALNMFEQNPEVFRKLESVSVTMDERLRKLSNYNVLSDPLSPLKVLNAKDETNTKVLDGIHDFCTKNYLHINKGNNKLSFSVNIEMTELQIDKVFHVLEEAATSVLE